MVRTKSSKQVFPIISSRTQFFGIWLLNYGSLILQFGLQKTIFCCLPDVVIFIFNFNSSCTFSAVMQDIMSCAQMDATALNFQLSRPFLNHPLGIWMQRCQSQTSWSMILTISEPSPWNLEAKTPVSNKLEYNQYKPPGICMMQRCQSQTSWDIIAMMIKNSGKVFKRNVSGLLIDISSLPLYEVRP